MGDASEEVEQTRARDAGAPCSQPQEHMAGASREEPASPEPTTRQGSIAQACAAPLTRSQWRARLLAQRQQAAHPAREQANQALLQRLAHVVGECAGRCVALYWPVRGEPHLGDWPARWQAQGATLALPVVQASGQPLLFCAWRPGAAAVPGAWGIPEPVDRVPVCPDVVVVPCVGFDRQGFRLGYGGGFYDRTLAQLATQSPCPPLALGVAWDDAECTSLQPLSTDWPLDVIVTPSAVYRRDGGAAARC